MKGWTSFYDQMNTVLFGEKESQGNIELRVEVPKLVHQAMYGTPYMQNMLTWIAEMQCAEDMISKSRSTGPSYVIGKKLQLRNELRYKCPPTSFAMRDMIRNILCK